MEYNNSCLEPLFLDLQEQLDMDKYVYTGSFARFIAVKKENDRLNEIIEDMASGISSYFYDSIDDFKAEGLLILIDELYSRDKDKFYRFVADLIIEYEDEQGFSIKTKQIIKDLEILDQFENHKELFTKLNEDSTGNQSNNKNIIHKDNNKVFIVHGHHPEMRLEVHKTITKLGLTPIILSEQPNGGKTIIEKFEHHSEVGYAIVLLSPCDEGRKKGTNNELRGRARQNVILELGYFYGKLGRKRVFPLISSDVEQPSDILGIAYTPFDKHDGWKLKLVQELRAAGYKVDANSLC